MSEQEKLVTEHMEEMTKSMTDVWQKNASMMTQFFNQSHQMLTKDMDPMNVGSAFTEAGKMLAGDPMKLMQANYELWKEHVALMQEATLDLMKKSGSADSKNPYDRRFKHEDWQSNPMFDYIRKSYLITSKWMVNTMTSIDGLSEADKKKIVFHSQLLADAFSPSNFFMTNPEAIRTMVESGGQSVIKGMQNLQRDLDPATSQLSIMMSDPDAFVLGKEYRHHTG